MVGWAGAGGSADMKVIDIAVVGGGGAVDKGD